MLSARPEIKEYTQSNWARDAVLKSIVAVVVVITANVEHVTKNPWVEIRQKKYRSRAFKFLLSEIPRRAKLRRPALVCGAQVY